MSARNTAAPVSRFADTGHIFIAGPLALDGHENAAYIISSEAMRLGADEFETLYMLACRENMPVSFECIYNAVWEPEDGADRRGEALGGITSVINIINSAGADFVWIEHNPSSGYVFRTKWGHNR